MRRVVALTRFLFQPLASNLCHHELAKPISNVAPSRSSFVLLRTPPIAGIPCRVLSTNTKEQPSPTKNEVEYEIPQEAKDPKWRADFHSNQAWYWKNRDELVSKFPNHFVAVAGQQLFAVAPTKRELWTKISDRDRSRVHLIMWVGHEDETPAILPLPRGPVLCSG